MANSLKYYLSFWVLLLSLSSCFEFSNETYHHLTQDEKRKMSADYTQLAKKLERGSSKNMRLLEKAVKINPNNDLAWRELSLPYLYAGMLEQWNAHMEIAMKLNPQAWQGWRGYQKLFFFRDYSGALFDFDATDTLTVDKTDYAQNISVDYLRGLCYLGLKDYPRSIEYFEKYIEDETKKSGAKYVDETAFLYLGIIANHERKYEKAIEYFNRAVKYETGNADMDYHKARALLHIGKIREAEELLLMAKKKFKDDKYMNQYYYEAIEQIYLSDINSLEANIKTNSN